MFFFIPFSERTMDELSTTLLANSDAFIKKFFKVFHCPRISPDPCFSESYADLILPLFFVPFGASARCLALTKSSE